jgi:hypothetical protein
VRDHAAVRFRRALAIMAVASAAACESGTVSRPAIAPIPGPTVSLVALGQTYAGHLTWTQHDDQVRGELTLTCRCARGTEVKPFKGRVWWNHRRGTSVRLRLAGGVTATGQVGRLAGGRTWAYLNLHPGPALSYETGDDAAFAQQVSILQERGGLRGHLIRLVKARRGVYHPDLDGDGTADRAIVRWVSLKDPSVALGRLALRVHLADGRQASRVDMVGFVPTRGGSDEAIGLPWIGVGDVDGLPGDELTMPMTTGASYVFEQVLAWRGSGLAVLPPPPGKRAWSHGGSVGTGDAWWGCRSGSLVTFDGAPIRRPPSYGFTGYRGVESQWRWQGAGWSRLSVVVHRNGLRGRPWFPPYEDCWTNNVRPFY